MSKYNSVLAWKLSATLFFNSALITFTIQVIRLRNFYGIGGIITAQSNFFLTNLILSPILDFFDVGFIIKTLMRKF
jgi:hypothetical protein